MANSWSCKSAVVEGAITVVFGALAFMFLPDTPGDAKFLSEDERRHALRRMRVDAHGATDQDDVKNEKFDWHWVKMGLLSFNTVMTSFAWFFLLVPLYVSSQSKVMAKLTYKTD